MLPLDGKTTHSSANSWNDLGRQAETIIDSLVNKLGTDQLEILKKGRLTISQITDLHKRVEQMAAEAERLFGNTCVDIKVQEFIRDQFSELISSVIQMMGSQVPDLIREAGLAEAIFSHKEDNHPILATAYLATCIGVAGYDPANRFGFVIHFTDPSEIDACGALLLSRIHAYRKQNSSAILLIHLRGGVEGMSEKLLAKVKKWLVSSGLSFLIASENTLQKPILPGIGIPKIQGSIKLDVRTGTCETYDPKENPYSERMDMHKLNFLAKDLIQAEYCLKPKIRIAYDPKGSQGEI